MINTNRKIAFNPKASFRQMKKFVLIKYLNLSASKATLT